LQTSTINKPMPFQPGISANQNGRPPGTRNKRDAELWSKFEARGDKDPAEFLSELVSNETEPKELRAQAANWLLPYKYAKRGAIPQSPEPRFINIEVRITKAMTVSQGRENLQFISELKAEGRIDVEYADSLFVEHTKILDALIEEAKLIVAQGGPSEQTIHIRGGLPDLPGTRISMPIFERRRHRRARPPASIRTAERLTLNACQQPNWR
jgi:hypothetical protein